MSLSRYPWWNYFTCDNREPLPDVGIIRNILLVVGALLCFCVGGGCLCFVWRVGALPIDSDLPWDDRALFSLVTGICRYFEWVSMGNPLGRSTH